MKKYILDEIMNNISTYQNHTDLELKQIRYGLETVYLTIFKTIVFIVLSVVLDYFKELILYMGFYGLLRLTGFGAHAKKSIHCWISSSLFFTGFPLMCRYLIFNNFVNISLSIISFLLLCIYAPADTEKRPLIHKKKRIIYKILTIVISTIYLVFIFNYDNQGVVNVLVLSLVTEAFMVSPLCYKMLGVPYNNYKTYLKNRKEKKK